MDASTITTRVSFLLTVLLLLSFLPTPSSSSRSLATKSVRCNPHDYAVLMKMKASLHNPHSLSSWLPNTNCCDWYGLYCDQTTSRIFQIAIYGSDIPFLPAEVGDLPYLTTIILQRNYNLSGTIPSTITKLKLLSFLTIDWNNLSGPIPSFLSQLPNLYYLSLTFSQFSGSIPSSLSSLPKLTQLSLNNNRLTGAIPESFGIFKRFYLDLSHNKLSGVIPKSLEDADFYDIDLSWNKLEGDALMLFNASEKIVSRRINLSRNRFEFNLSKVGIPEELNLLDISHNKIFGSIPEAITGSDFLQTLNVSYNRLCGKIPQGGEVQKFDSTSFFHNKCLCGSPLAACN